MRAARLSEEEVAAALKALPEWCIEAGMLRRTFTFTGFAPAIAFTVQVAFAAEKADHHPDIDIRWNKVRLALVTHDSGGLTQKDFALAGEADAIFGGNA